MSHTYIFSPRFDEDGVYVDTFLDVTPCVGLTKETAELVVATAKKLGSTIPSQHNPFVLSDQVQKMQMRARLNSTNLHKVTTEEPITFNDLDRVLKDYQTRNLLRNFLKESRL